VVQDDARQASTGPSHGRWRSTLLACSKAAFHSRSILKRMKMIFVGGDETGQNSNPKWLFGF